MTSWNVWTSARSSRPLALLMLASSKAFVDFSTSGLETSLSFLLLSAFLWRWWSAPAGPRRLYELASVGGLCLLNRMDLGLLVLPAVMVESWRLGIWRA